MTIAIVTDSTAYLPPAVVAQRGILVVPLHVVLGGQEHSEGVDVTAADVATALRSFVPVSTSRPAPQAFLEAYAEAIAPSFRASCRRRKRRTRAARKTTAAGRSTAPTPSSRSSRRASSSSTEAW